MKGPKSSMALLLAGLSILAMLTFATALPAQQPGDSVRIWNEAGNMVGRLVRQDSLAVVFREGAIDRAIPRAEVRRIDVWKPRNAAVEITLGAVACGFLAADTWKQDPLVGAGIGALLEVASLSIWPGRWHRVRLRG